MTHPGRFVLTLLLTLALATISGCHSAFVQATVTNASPSAIRLFEVDYPSASFGAGDLAPGATFKYRFKVLGTGPLALSWTDHAGTDHTAKGPEVHEGVEGRLGITIRPTGADWSPELH